MGASLTNWEFSADSSKVFAELRKMIDLNKELEAQLKKQSKETDKQQARYEAALKKLTTENQKLERAQKGMFASATEGFKAIGVSISAAGIAAGIKQMISLQAEYNRELAKTAIEQDKVGRKLQVQALLKDDQFQIDLRKSILPIANKFALPLADVQMGATELLNQGVDKKQAMGGVLEEVIAGALATGTNATEFGGGVVGLLRARNEEITPESVRQVSSMLAGAFEKNRIQGADIGQLSQIGALSNQFGISKSELLGAFTTLRHEGSFDAGQSVTALRNIIVHMATAGTKKGKLGKDLEAIGGKDFAKEFDMVGESFPQALANLTSALESADPETRIRVMKGMFGDENISGASVLLSRAGLGNIATKQQQMAGGDAVLQEALQVATTGDANALQRMRNDLEMAKLNRAQAGIDQEMASVALETIGAESNAPGWLLSLMNSARSVTGSAFDVEDPEIERRKAEARQAAELSPLNVRPEGISEVQFRDFSQAAADLKQAAADMKAAAAEQKKAKVPEEKPAQPPNRGANG